MDTSTPYTPTPDEVSAIVAGMIRRMRAAAENRDWDLMDRLGEDIIEFEKEFAS